MMGRTGEEKKTNKLWNLESRWMSDKWLSRLRKAKFQASHKKIRAQTNLY